MMEEHDTKNENDSETNSLAYTELHALLAALDNPALINESIINLVNSEGGKAFREEINHKYSIRKEFAAIKTKLKQQRTEEEEAHLRDTELARHHDDEKDKYVLAHIQRLLR